MRSILSLITLCFILVLPSQAQLDYSWGHHYGSSGYDNVNDIAIDSDGNVYIIGEFENSITRIDGKTDSLHTGGYRQALLIKHKPSGEIIWSHQIGGSAFDRGTGIALDEQGSLFITGVISNVVDMDPGSGTFEINADSSGFGPCVYLAKFDTAGNFSWAKAFHNTTQSNAADGPFGIDCDSDGNVIIAGAFFTTMRLSSSVTLSAPGTVGEAYLAKFNSSGGLQWAHAIGGNGDQRIMKIHVDGSDNILATGFFFGTTDFDPGSGVDERTSKGAEDIFIAKYTKDGDYTWSIAAGSPSGGSVATETGLDIEADEMGNVFVAGRILGDVDFDPSADSAILYRDGVNSSFLVKYDADGNYVNVLRLRGSFFHVAQALTIDEGNNCYLAGQFGGEFDLDPSEDSAMLFSGTSDAYLVKYSNDLEYVDGLNMRGSGEENSSVLSCRGGSVYWGGYFSTNFIAGPQSNPVLWLGAGVQDMFILKFKSDTFDASDTSGNTARIIEIDSRVRLYPNPANKGFSVEVPGDYTQVRMYNNQGIVVAVWDPQSFYALPESIAPGAYFIRVVGNRSYYTRILVE